MPKISELKDSKYIKKEDCPLELRIEGVTQENVGTDGKEDIRWVMHFMDHDKGLILNTTNGTIMAENFGSEEMDDWKGKVVELYNDRNVMFAGKRTGGVRVKSKADLPKAKEGDDEEIPF